MSFTSSSLSSRKSLWGEDLEEEVRGVVGNDERGTSDSTPAIWMSSPSSSELAKKGPGGGLEGICILKRVSSWELNKRVPKRDSFKQNQTGHINRQIHAQSNSQNAARFTYGIVRLILLDIEADTFPSSNRPSSFFVKEQTLRKATPSCFPTYPHALPSRRPFRVLWGPGEWTN